MKERKKRKRRARALECFERPRVLSLFLSLSLGGVRVAGSPRRGRRPFRGKVKERKRATVADRLASINYHIVVRTMLDAWPR